jgi:hypothetical protein
VCSSDLKTGRAGRSFFQRPGTHAGIRWFFLNNG